LANRLDQTSKDLSAAREVIASEDITSEIFPSIEIQEEELDEDFEGDRPTVPFPQASNPD
jgi:hypothetical protein